MPEYDPIEVLFGRMEKLGAGSDDETRRVLHSLPTQQFPLTVDVGCGRGRQSVVLARELATVVHAIDSHQPFLDDLARRASELGLDQLIETHCLDMQDLSGAFDQIDLLWCEGAIYNIGFENGLSGWAAAIKPRGFAVVSELSWISEQADETVKQYWMAAYPGMVTVEQNGNIAQNLGYKVLDTHVLPSDTWVNDYYDVLGPRATKLLNHSDEAIKQLAAEMLTEIEMFESARESIGYVFYSLQRVS